MNKLRHIKQMGLSKNSSRLLMIILVAAVSIGSMGCKSQKKLAREAAKKEAEAKAIQIEKATKELNSIIDGSHTGSLDEKERTVNRIKAMNLGDPALSSLIAQAESKLNEERAALDKQNEEKDKESGSLENNAKLDQYFNAIANASSITAANSNINEALSMFSSPDALVLIIISKSGDVKDYDRPTTIRKYLEYLKDQKKNINAIDKLVLDDQGKIKEVELIKK